MDLEQAAKEIEYYFAAGITVELVSAPGVGKSDMIEWLVTHLSKRDQFTWGLGSLMLATTTPIDLMGFMIPEKTLIEGQEMTISKFTTPHWLFSHEGKLLSSYKKAVLFLDEYGQGEPDVKKTSAQLLLKGEIGPHKLGPNCHVVAASNRVSDRSGVTKQFDFVINRKATLLIEPSFSAWEAWATRVGLPPLFIVFAKKNADTVFKGEIPRDQGPFCTPRSFVAGCRYIMARQAVRKLHGEPDLPNYGVENERNAAAMQVGLNGIFGEATSTAMLAWLKMRTQTPDFADIVADPKGCPVPKAIDALMLTAYECAYNVDFSTVDKVCQYIKKMDDELHVTFAKAAIKRNHAIVTTDPMAAFVKHNTALINAIGD